jgi:hypothetical protein
MAVVGSPRAWSPPSCVAYALLLGALLYVRPAHAEPRRTWSLRWQAPRECPTQQDVRSTVEHWLAQSVEPRDPSGIRVEATVQHQNGGFALDLLLVTPSSSGHEQLRAAQCATLAGVVALKVALVADPGAWFDRLASESSGDSAWLLRLTGGFGPGVLPGIGPMFQLSGGRRFSRVALELGIGYALPNDARYAGLPDGAKIDVLYAGPRVCALPNMGTVEFPLCAGVEFGLMRGKGYGPDLTSVFTTTQMFGAIVIAPAVRWPLTKRLAAWFGVEALIAVLKPSFRLRNLDRLFAPEQIGAQVQIGAELRLD